MISMGYKREDIIKILKKTPEILGFNADTLKQKMDSIISLGYTREEVINIVRVTPPVLSYSLSNMKQKIKDIMSLGYTKEEVLNMTKEMPAIYGASIENIRKKIEFYDSIGMHKLPIVNTKDLMQSVELSYARYQFYLSKGIYIDTHNYRKLFTNEKEFSNAYGITKKELLEMYKYEDIKELKKVD